MQTSNKIGAFITIFNIALIKLGSKSIRSFWLLVRPINTFWMVEKNKRAHVESPGTLLITLIKFWHVSEEYWPLKMASSILFIILLLNVSLWLAMWLIVLLAISLSFWFLFEPAVSRNNIWCCTSNLSWIKKGQYDIIFKEFILCSGSLVLN